MEAFIQNDGLLVVQDGDGTRHIIAPGAVASWSKLLGYTDVVDTVDAIVHVARNGEPPVDPATGENCWSEDFIALQFIEEAREAEAFRALVEGRRDDPRSPLLRATLAARAANLGAVGAVSERESLLAQCQSKARFALGVMDPQKVPSSSRRIRMTCEDEPQTDDCPVRERALRPEDRVKVKACLEAVTDAVPPEQEYFCHSLTGNEENPIPIRQEIPVEAPEPGLDGIDGLMARYPKKVPHAA